MLKLKTKSHFTYYLLLSTLFLAAFLERTVWDLGPNIELVTTAVVLASLYLGRKNTFWLTFAIIALSDRVIGNSKIFLFTWSGFLLPAFFLPNLFKNLKLNIKNYRWKLFGLMGSGLLANLFFFIYTNLGVWLLDSWGMYTKDASGLIKCYIMGLPFLKNQLISSLIFIPAGYFLIELGLSLAKKMKLNFLPQTNKIPLK
jgi:hypothetical protein